MITLRTVGLALILAFSSLPISLASQGGPPPEIRERVQAFTDALNSASPERWEKMTAAHFSAKLLARLGPEERRQLFDSLRADFGP